MAILLASFYFFYFSVVGVYIIFIPKVLTSFAYSPQEIGILLAAGPLVRFILPMLFIRGLQLDKRTFNVALVLMSVSGVFFYNVVENFYQLLVTNLFLGIGLGIVLPYVEVVALEFLGKENYGKIRLFGSLGFILVALVLVKVLSDPKIALVFLLCLLLLTAIIAYIIAHELQKSQQKEPLRIKNDITLIKDYKLWLGLLFMQLSFGAFYNFFTIYNTDNGISLQTTIYLWSFGVFIEIVMFYFQARFLQKNLLFLLQMTTLITVLRWFLVFAFAQNTLVLYFSQSLHAFSFALFHSAAIAYLHKHYKHKVLAQQFFSGIAYGLGGILGAILSGFIYEHYPRYLFLSAALIALGALLFVSLYKREVATRESP